MTQKATELILIADKTFDLTEVACIKAHYWGTLVLKIKKYWRSRLYMYSNISTYSEFQYFSPPSEQQKFRNITQQCKKYSVLWRKFIFVSIPIIKEEKVI